MSGLLYGVVSRRLDEAGEVLYWYVFVRRAMKSAAGR